MHPIILQNKYFAIHSLWIFLAIGLIAGSITLIKLAKRNNLKTQFITENFLILLIASIIGARIFALILNYANYFYAFNIKAILEIFYIWDKGLNAWGAILGLGISLYLLCKRKEQNFFKWLDIMTPSIIVILAITYMGTFFDGSHYGRETNLPWGVNFESPSIKYTVPIHPTQIYAFIYATITAITLILLDQHTKIKTKFSDGIIGFIGIIGFGTFKFMEEFVRGDETLMIFSARISQITTLLTILIAGIFFYMHYNKIKFTSKKSYKKKRK